MKKTKEKLIIIAYSLCMLFCFAIILNTVQPFTQYIGKSSGDAYDVIYSIEDMENYIKNKYSKNNVFDLNIEMDNYKILKSRNVAQRSMNTYYYDKMNRKIKSTCVEVATSILRYMYSNESEDYRETFCDIIDYAEGKKYYDCNRGTNGGKVEKIVEYAFSQNNYTKKLKIYKNNWNVYSVLKDNIDSNHLTYFNITNHAMVGAGYIEYKVTWKQDFKFLFFKKTQKYECVEKFVVVNAGWYDKETKGQDGLNQIGEKNVYQIYPEDKIMPNTLNSLVNIAKFFNIEFKNK